MVKSKQLIDSSRSDASLAFAFGVFLALLQFTYFFLLEAFLSSRAIPFFISLIFWLIGFLIGLNIKRRHRLPWLISLSLVAYYVALLLVRTLPFRTGVLGGVGLCIAASGMLPGFFFPYARERFGRVKFLFLHENNGFILGILASSWMAITAGKWMLAYGPLLGILPVVGVLFYQAKIKKKRKPATSVFHFWVMGLHFGIFQVAVFFVAQINVTATYFGYFLVVIAWMVGLMISMKMKRSTSLFTSLLLSAAAYYSFVLVSSFFAPRPILWIPYAGLAVVIALPAGVFFRSLSQKYSSHSLFFHENNGFVFGFLLSMFGFVQWGIHFLYLAPLVSLALTLLIEKKMTFTAWEAVVVIGILSFGLGNQPAAFLLALFALLGGGMLYVTPIRATQETAEEAAPCPERSTMPSRRMCKWILFIAGFNAIELQYFITREFSSILGASEVAILIVASAFFVSYSVGYGFSRRLPPRWLYPAALATFLLHLGVLVFSKSVAGFLINAGLGEGVLFGLLFLASFCTAPLYSILLPKFIDAQGKRTLPQSYLWDLSGAIAGILVMMILTAYAPAALWPVYFLLLLLLIILIMPENPWVPGLALFGGLLIFFLIRYQNSMNRYATEDYYETREYSHPKLLFTGHSFYHTIDVIESFSDAEQTRPRARTSFINGVRYFTNSYKDSKTFGEESTLSEFTYYLAELPAKYLSHVLRRKLRVLVMGAGSMYSLARLKDTSFKTTMVEIDPLVVESSKKSWADFNHYDKIDNYEIIINDAKNYLMTTDERFDLIVNDVSAPYYLGTTLMHSQELYELAKSRLTPDGLLAESTQSWPNPRKPRSQGMKILAGVASVFTNFCVVEHHFAEESKKGFVYASDHYKIAGGLLIHIMDEDGKLGGMAIYNQARKRYRLDRVRPYSLSNMDILLSGNVWRIKSQLRLAGVNKNVIIPATSSRLLKALRRKLTSLPVWLMLMGGMVLAVFFRFLPRKNQKPLSNTR